jgi:hypothetical protein
LLIALFCLHFQRYLFFLTGLQICPIRFTMARLLHLSG